MNPNTKQEELKEMANHTIGNCMGNHSCFYMNLPTGLSDSEIDEAISNEIVSRINSEATAVLEEVGKIEVEGIPLSCVVAIQQIKQRYGGK